MTKSEIQKVIDKGGYIYGVFDVDDEFVTLPYSIEREGMYFDHKGWWSKDYYSASGFDYIINLQREATPEEVEKYVK